MANYTIKRDPLFTRKYKKIIAKLPKDMYDLWMFGSIFLAGGAIRSYFENEEPRDLDFFCIDQEIFNQCNSILLNAGFISYFKEVNFFKYKKDNLEVDIVLLLNSKNIIDVLETFDFTISKAGYHKGSLIIHNHFNKDLENKKLVYCGSHDPKASWVRQVVFKEMGYTIDNRNLSLIDKDINKIDTF